MGRWPGTGSGGGRDGGAKRTRGYLWSLRNIERWMEMRGEVDEGVEEMRKEKCEREKRRR